MEGSFPENWKRVDVVDSHAAGEPLRAVVDGMPKLTAETMVGRMQEMRENHDWVRTTLLREPRGHTEMYGAVLTDPVTEDGDVGVLFIHNDGYATMCGHGIIALTTILLETGRLPAAGPNQAVRFDTPAGRVVANATIDDEQVSAVSFENVLSFVSHTDRTVDVPKLGTVEFDIAFGGGFFAFCDADELGLSLTTENARTLLDIGESLNAAIKESVTLTHPNSTELEHLYGTIFTGEPHENGHSRNVNIYGDRRIDRSPSGTGVSARLALRFAAGQIERGEEFIVESILGTTFSGKIIEEDTVGDTSAVLPKITGSAYLTGYSSFVVDPADPLKDGFLLE